MPIKKAPPTNGKRMINANTVDYSKMFSKRKDGYYQVRLPYGKCLYDRDPQRLFEKYAAWSPIKDKPTFAQVADEWQGIHRDEIEETTWSNYRTHYNAIIKAHGRKCIDEVTPKNCIDEMAELKRLGKSHTTINHRKIIYRMIYDYAVIAGYMQYNPFLSVKTPRGVTDNKRAAPSQAQIKTILSHSDDFDFFPFFLLLTGLRRGEACALLKTDIDIPKREISVTKALQWLYNGKPHVKPPKSVNGVRKVPITDALLAPLVKHIEETDGEIVFPQPDAEEATYYAETKLRRQWESYCERYNLDGLSMHQLRHGMATIMFEAGCDMLTCQSILGHSRVQTTMDLYTDLTDSKKLQSVACLNEKISRLCV